MNVILEAARDSVIEEIEENRQNVREMVIAREVYSEEKTQEMKIFEELEKGIGDMEAGRVIEHEETMRILKERVSQYAL